MKRDDDDTQAPKRGRPPRLTPRARVHNVTIDAGAFLALNTVRKQLESELGFLPTHSQTVMHLIRGRGRDFPR